MTFSASFWPLFRLFSHLCSSFTPACAIWTAIFPWHLSPASGPHGYYPYSPHGITLYWQLFAPLCPVFPLTHPIFLRSHFLRLHTRPRQSTPHTCSHILDLSFASQLHIHIPLCLPTAQYRIASGSPPRLFYPPPGRILMNFSHAAAFDALCHLALTHSPYDASSPFSQPLTVSASPHMLFMPTPSPSFATLPFL